MKGITKSGFEFTIEDESLDNAELLEDISTMVNGNGLIVFDIMKEMLGEDGKTALFEHCRNDKGKVSMKKVSEEFNEIFELVDKDLQGKN